MGAMTTRTVTSTHVDDAGNRVTSESVRGMFEPRETEAPCDDGNPCDFLGAEEWETEDGTGAWDHYCTRCFRWRDWTKAEMPPK